MSLIKKRNLTMKKYGLPEFEELKTSTRTMMVYTNIHFDLEKIFKSVEITKVAVPLTKKKKNVDKKKLEAPYGSIISVQKGTRFRGINLRKYKEHWCSANCRLEEQRGDKMKKINTVVEEVFKVKGTDMHEFKYYCRNCKTYYSLKQLKKIPNFLNQVTLVISIGKIILNIMLFSSKDTKMGNFKIAGCKEDIDAHEATMILWQDYISQISGGWNILDPIWDPQPKFLFRLVMRNVDFKLGFFIDREELNNLMNSPIYRDKVFMSQCEATGHTNVNIKMFANKPKGYLYDCLVMPLNKEAYFIELNKNPYKPKKKKKDKHTTFIVFSSSEIILSGRYEENMKEMYEFFVSEVIKNKKRVEEKLNEPKEDLNSHLKRLGF